jgi:Tol biopolymer transport system component
MGAAWAPDGAWMYFTADAGDGFHVWRQRVTDGTPEQVTSGPTEEQGIVISPDGRSLITSVGLTSRTVWIHDGSGERQVSLEGYAYWPLLSSDGRRLCFRITHGVGTGQSPSELWVIDLASNQAERLFPGQLVTSYDVSRGGRVVASVVNRSGSAALWVTSLDGRDAPRPVPRADGDNPRYAPDETILFRVLEAPTAWMYRIREDGSHRERIGEVSGTVFGTVSPDGEWISGYSVNGRNGMTLFSTSHRQPIPLSSFGQTSRLRWSPDGTRLYLSIQYGEASAFGIGRTYVVPLPRGSILPRLAADRFRTEKDAAALPGVETLPYGDVGPGPSPAAYTFSRITTARNLYRIPIP